MEASLGEAGALSPPWRPIRALGTVRIPPMESGSDVDEAWSPARVLAAAAEWVWLPDGVEQLETEDYHLVAYPDWFGNPTQVAWCRSTRPADALVDEVTDKVRSWRRNEVSWWVAADTRPGALESELRARGAKVSQTVDVLAFDMSDTLPDPGDTDGLRCVLVEDEATLRAASTVAQEVWGEAPTEETEEAVAKELADLARPIGERQGFRVVAFLGEEPVSTGGCTLAGDVARLWGAATRPDLRGRGAYRATLMKRLEVAREYRATLGLVKGRVETSAPILRRIGFETYGQEILYTLAL